MPKRKNTTKTQKASTDKPTKPEKEKSDNREPTGSASAGIGSGGAARAASPGVR